MDSAPLVYVLGFIAQGLFSARILVQWIMSEKAGKVVSPTIFWVLSLIASYLFFIYGWLRNDFSIMLGQVIGYCVYIWNLKAKGVWHGMKPALKRLLAFILVATPVTLLALMLRDPAAAAASLFSNEKIPLWLILLGSLGQVIFSLRFLYQALYSARHGESLLPAGFWIISLAGSAIIIAYGIIRLDPVIILGQACGFISYTRNLMIWKKSHAS